MSEIRLKFDSAGFRALLLSDGVKDLVTDKTTEIAQRANANAGGDGFETFVKDGDEVKAGQKLLTFSSDKIKAAGHSNTVAVILTNADDLEGLEFGLKE